MIRAALLFVWSRVWRKIEKAEAEYATGGPVSDIFSHPICYVHFRPLVETWSGTRPILTCVECSTEAIDRMARERGTITIVNPPDTGREPQKGSHR